MRWFGGLFLALVILTSAAGARADTTADNIAYCTAKGGVAQFRVPLYGTNGGTPLVLAGQAGFCQFTSPTDHSKIYVQLATLTTPMPTLAALAYYAAEPLTVSCEGSPGSCYCSQIGGTDLFGGISAAGGGWALKNNYANVLDTCVFPDGSSIDSYGLFYHSAGIIRGTDLNGVLAYPDPY